jgi:hypothetical protein
VSSAPPAFQFERRRHPRVTHQQPFVPGAVDPDLTRSSNTISPGKLLILLSVVAILAMACDGPVHSFLTRYNDNIVAILMGCFPALLVGIFMVGRRLYAFWRTNLQIAAELESQRKAQISAVRATSRPTEPGLHLLPRRPDSHTQAA